ncbi:hypothetical protein TrispH2_007475 [Trichoplax sp. H2]|nr:hypothetical protein TrispH2_007475 [Trichoplax sp. H2]|eukprot:RDD40937.1 hypothetical protein TrispH2_007475 [Trichoplax sp. H2]
MDVTVDPNFKINCIHSWKVNNRYHIELLAICYYFLIILLLPGAVISYCHFKAIRKLRQIGIIMKQRFVHVSSRRSDKERAIKMLICVSALFFTTALPVAIKFANTLYFKFNASILTIDDRERNMIIETLLHVLVFLAPLHNPLIYLTKKNLICRCPCIRIRHTNLSE